MPPEEGATDVKLGRVHTEGAEGPNRYGRRMDALEQVGWEQL